MGLSDRDHVDLMTAALCSLAWEVPSPVPSEWTGDACCSATRPPLQIQHCWRWGGSVATHRQMAPTLHGSSLLWDWSAGVERTLTDLDPGWSQFILADLCHTNANVNLEISKTFSQLLFSYYLHFIKRICGICMLREFAGGEKRQQASFSFHVCCSCISSHISIYSSTHPFVFLRFWWKWHRLKSSSSHKFILFRVKNEDCQY